MSSLPLAQTPATSPTLPTALKKAISPLTRRLSRNSPMRFRRAFPMSILILPRKSPKLSSPSLKKLPWEISLPLLNAINPRIPGKKIRSLNKKALIYYRIFLRRPGSFPNVCRIRIWSRQNLLKKQKNRQA